MLTPIRRHNKYNMIIWLVTNCIGILFLKTSGPTAKAMVVRVYSRPCAVRSRVKALAKGFRLTMKEEIQRFKLQVSINAIPKGK